jgi:hypothetical protein
MKETIFDELTKAIATSTSRRQAIQRIGGILGGTALAGLFPGLALANNSDCAHFCNSIFAPGPARGQCTSDAAHHTGLCYTCGPASPGGTKPICCPENSNGQCTSYSSATCCSGGQACQNGTCCTQNGSHCTQDSQCCSGVCDEYTSTCGCAPVGTGCDRNADCCSGNCVSNGRFHICAA